MVLGSVTSLSSCYIIICGPKSQAAASCSNLEVALFNAAYRTRSNYSNILIIRTVYIIILFLSNSLNMLHLEFLTRSIRPNGHTPVQQRSLQAKKMISSPSLQLIKIIVLVTIDTQRPAARDYMYYDECIQGGIFSPVLL